MDQAPQTELPDDENGNRYENMLYGVIPPETLVERYKKGWFVMSDAPPPGYQGDPIMEWVSYSPRGVVPLDAFHVPHGTRSLLRNHPYHITVDQDFENVIRGCAELTDKPDRDDTWINEEIIQSYVGLHKAGHAHSIEVRDDDGQLVGGLYGVSIGGVFCGESMFSRVPGASKIALVKLVSILKEAGYGLLDVQEVGALTKQFGAIELPRATYESQLAAALAAPNDPNARFVETAERLRDAPLMPPIPDKGASFTR